MGDLTPPALFVALILLFKALSLRIALGTPDRKSGDSRRAQASKVARAAREFFRNTSIRLRALGVLPGPDVARPVSVLLVVWEQLEPNLP